MDKIKENGFAISVALLVVGLLAFLWFWTISPLMELGEVEASASSLKSKIAGYQKMEVKPTKKYEEYLGEYQERLTGALTKAVEFYAEKRTNFDEFLPDTNKDMAAGPFKANFSTAVEELKKKYMAIVPPSESTEEDSSSSRTESGQSFPFRVQEIDVLTSEDVARAMKHYWILEEIFAALHENEIGGLQSIVFPASTGSATSRSRAAVEEPKSFESIRATIEVKLPVEKLRAFVISIFDSTRVPFIDVETFSVEKTPVEAIQELIREKDYNRHSEAAADKAAFTGESEPPITLKMTVVAMDWRGIPEKKEEEPEKK